MVAPQLNHQIIFIAEPPSKATTELPFKHPEASSLWS